MLQAIGQLLPIAVAAAISSVPIMAMIIILLSPRRSQAALPFLFGWVLGIATVVTVCALCAQALPISSGHKPQVGIGIAEVLVGVALVVSAVVSWRRGLHESTSEMPKWLRRIDSFGGWPAFGIAFLLNLRPKGLLLGIAAGLVLRGADLPVTEAAIAILIYTLIASSTIVVPIVMTLLDSKTMEPRLVETQDWLETHHAVVSSLILAMIGVIALGNGLTRL